MIKEIKMKSFFLDRLIKAEIRHLKKVLGDKEIPPFVDVLDITKDTPKDIYYYMKNKKKIVESFGLKYEEAYRHEILIRNFDKMSCIGFSINKYPGENVIRVGQEYINDITRRHIGDIYRRDSEEFLYPAKNDKTECWRTLPLYTLSKLPPTSLAIILAARKYLYDAKKVVIIGKGMLVGHPVSSFLKRLKQDYGYKFKLIELDSSASNDKWIEACTSGDLIITCTGANSISQQMLATYDGMKRVIIDVGVREENGQYLSDFSHTGKCEDCDIVHITHFGNIAIKLMLLQTLRKFKSTIN